MLGFGARREYWPVQGRINYWQGSTKWAKPSKKEKEKMGLQRGWATDCLVLNTSSIPGLWNWINKSTGTVAQSYSRLSLSAHSWTDSEIPLVKSKEWDEEEKERESLCHATPASHLPYFRQTTNTSSRGRLFSKLRKMVLAKADLLSFIVYCLLSLLNAFLSCPKTRGWAKVSTHWREFQRPKEGTSFNPTGLLLFK